VIYSATGAESLSLDLKPVTEKGAALSLSSWSDMISGHKKTYATVGKGPEHNYENIGDRASVPRPLGQDALSAMNAKSQSIPNSPLAAPQRADVIGVPEMVRFRDSRKHH